MEQTKHLALCLRWRSATQSVQGVRDDAKRRHEVADGFGEYLRDFCYASRVLPLSQPLRGKCNQQKPDNIDASRLATQAQPDLPIPRLLEATPATV